ncbi:DUF6461 domain-containing protein [Nonomuraea sp. NPDC049684]|uniref:DUF6461 domain-containing protein n=1 Tax=unclassified Nonomuraea TaxID=2593643 RepID=UPI0037B2B30C
MARRGLTSRLQEVSGQARCRHQPRFPIDRHGPDPDRLNRHLRELGIDPIADDHIDNPIPAALAIAGRLTGVLITPEHLRGPILGAAIPAY